MILCFIISYCFRTVIQEQLLEITSEYLANRKHNHDD